MSYVECHVLTMNCDVCNKRRQFSDTDRHNCWEQAEDEGWVISRQAFRAVCPKCSGQSPKEAAQSVEG